MSSQRAGGDVACPTLPVAPGTGSDRSPTRARLLTLVAAVLIGVPLLVGAVSAHVSLVESDPVDGVVLETAPTVVRLTFDGPVDPFEPDVQVFGTDGQSYESGRPTVDGSTVAVAIRPILTRGEFTVAFTVAAADGHVVDGETHFSLSTAEESVLARADGGGVGSTGPTARTTTQGGPFVGTFEPAIPDTSLPDSTPGEDPVTDGSTPATTENLLSDATESEDSLEPRPTPGSSVAGAPTVAAAAESAADDVTASGSSWRVWLLIIGSLCAVAATYAVLRRRRAGTAVSTDPGPGNGSEHNG